MNKRFLTAMYLRLSRDDEDIKDVGDKGIKAGKTGSMKSESNSIGSQRELLKTFIREQQDMELYDVYVDDGFTGSNFDRPEFKRMISDIEAGRVNCVIVKDLSRFGRDYIEAGRYLQKIFPAQGIRFIALTDHYDSQSSDVGESNIILPVKNFINDSYCRDISAKVKSQLEVKTKNGECIAAFAVYGYQKDKENKNRLVKDEYASGIVQNIFSWKVEGMAVAAIAGKLNSLGTLSPKEYKKSLGLAYHGGFSSAAKSGWSSSSVKRILTNEVYLGHMIQGKTEKVNYKVKKNVEKPKEEWVKVENTHEPIISETDFMIVQNLLKTDGRASALTKKANPFTGLLFCGDCREQMVRRVNRYHDTVKIYYICSTKNRGEGCSRHSIEEETLKELVSTAVKKYANAFLGQKKLFEKAKELETNFDVVSRYDKELERLKKEQEKYCLLCSGLHEDLKNGVVTKREFERLHGEFKRKEQELTLAQDKQEQLLKEIFHKGILSGSLLKMFQDTAELSEIDRHTLCSLVKRILVYEDKSLQIDFYFMDQFKIMIESNEEMGKQKVAAVKSSRERSP